MGDLLAQPQRPRLEPILKKGCRVITHKGGHLHGRHTPWKWASPDRRLRDATSTSPMRSGHGHCCEGDVIALRERWLRGGKRHAICLTTSTGECGNRRMLSSWGHPCEGVGWPDGSYANQIRFTADGLAGTMSGQRPIEQRAAIASQPAGTPSSDYYSTASQGDGCHALARVDPPVSDSCDSPISRAMNNAKLGRAADHEENR